MNLFDLKQGNKLLVCYIYSSCTHLNREANMTNESIEKLLKVVEDAVLTPNKDLMTWHSRQALE